MNANNSAEQNTAIKLNEFRLAKRSFLLIGSNLLKLFVQLAIIYIFSRQLSFENYALYQSVWLYVNILSVLGLFGLPALLLSSSANDIKQWIFNNKKNFLLFSCLLNIVPIIYLLFLAKQYTINNTLLLIAVTLFQNLSIIAETIAIKNKQETRILVTNIIFAVGYFVVHYSILKNGYSLSLILAWLVLIFIIKTLFLWNFQANNFPKNHQINTPHLGKQWFLLGLFDVISTLYKWLDKWLILLFISITQFAIYFNGSYEIPIFGLMLGTVGNIMLVELSGKKLNPALNSKILFHHSAVFLGSIVFPAFCFLLFFHHDLFLLIFSSKYEASIPIFFVSIFVLPVRITNFTAVLQVQHRNDIIIKGALLDLVLAIILLAILYPLWGLKGLALAFVLSTYMQAWYYLWHTSILLKLPIKELLPFKKLGLLMLVCLVIMGLAKYIFLKISYPANMIAGIIISIFCAAFFLYLFLNKDIQNKFFN